ncbi:PAS domain-containing sensor histidine kinase [Persicimonas caeni]|uniref:PAS domain-containing sensor histidine kinase n=1 Tax=Persicimonas caeni TaxID=2292766 RepID=UPI00143DFF0E|nr:PAS domain-containing sensor histidine kinase [Persicimonas caeni]
MADLVTDGAEAQIQFEAIFEHSPNSMACADPQRRLIRVNQKFTELFGYTEQECLGRTTKFLYAHPEEYGRTGEQRYNVDAPLQPDAYVTEYRRKDGTTFFAETTGVQLRDNDGSLIGFIGVQRDLTEQIEFEAERRRLNEARSEFVAMVSHELRTPLTALLGTLDLLGRRGAELPGGVDRLVAMALRNGRRLGALINDILDVEKIDSGQLTMELDFFDVCDLVDDVVLGNQSFAEQHDVELRLSCSARAAEVCLDAGRFEQVLTNLLSNAIKFSPSGEVVEVVVQRVWGNRVRIEVCDHGPGIPGEFQGRIFERFAQAGTKPVRRTPGTGLGLSIARGLTEKMGGSIGFETEEGNGTTMYVEFPLEV